MWRFQSLKKFFSPWFRSENSSILNSAFRSIQSVLEKEAFSLSTDLFAGESDCSPNISLKMSTSTSISIDSSNPLSAILAVFGYCYCWVVLVTTISREGGVIWWVGVWLCVVCVCVSENNVQPYTLTRTPIGSYSIAGACAFAAQASIMLKSIMHIIMF